MLNRITAALLLVTLAAVLLATWTAPWPAALKWFLTAGTCFLAAICLHTSTSK